MIKRQWEHVTIKPMLYYSLARQLRERSEHGWELVSVVAVGGSVYAFLKRERTNDTQLPEWTGPVEEDRDLI